MFFMYIDESGDVGKNNSPSQSFVISAIVLHENSWQNVLDDLIAFRKALKKGARTFYTTFLANVTNRYVTRYPSPNNIVEI